MKRRVLVLSVLFGGYLMSSVGFGFVNSSALTYQDNIETSFTFNSSVSLSLSSPNLTISELPATTYAESNVITLSAASNNPYGYTVTATAGNGTTYTTTDLVNTGNGDYIFSSLATNASYNISSSDFAPGKWGYTFSTDSGTTWINETGSAGYSGLPYTGTAGAEIISSNQNGSTTADFKIGAKAASNQPAGEYKNVVNFTITAAPEPVGP